MFQISLVVINSKLSLPMTLSHWFRHKLFHFEEVTKTSLLTVLVDFKS